MFFFKPTVSHLYHNLFQHLPSFCLERFAQFPPLHLLNSWLPPIYAALNTASFLVLTIYRGFYSAPEPCLALSITDFILKVMLFRDLTDLTLADEDAYLSSYLYSLGFFVTPWN